MYILSVQFGVLKAQRGSLMYSTVTLQICKSRYVFFIFHSHWKNVKINSTEVLILPPTPNIHTVTKAIGKRMFG